MEPLGSIGSVGWDEAVFRALNLAGSNAVLDAVMVLATLLSAAYVLPLLSFALWGRGNRAHAVDFLVLLALTILVTEAIKFGIGRPRPNEVLTGVNLLALWPSTEFDPAFPSGHASRAFATAGFLGLRFRWRAGLAGTAFAVVAGISRVYLGVHWPSDVLGGAALGLAMGVLVPWTLGRVPAYERLRERTIAAIRRIGRRSRA